jgi:hypothetical protein
MAARSSLNHKRFIDRISMLEPLAAANFQNCTNVVVATKLHTGSEGVSSLLTAAFMLGS